MVSSMFIQLFSKTVWKNRSARRAQGLGFRLDFSLNLATTRLKTKNFVRLIIYFSNEFKMLVAMILGAKFCFTMVS